MGPHHSLDCGCKRHMARGRPHYARSVNPLRRAAAPLIRRRIAGQRTDLVVYCGECGHNFNTDIVIENPTQERVRQAFDDMVAKAEIQTCPRCGSTFRAATLGVEPHHRLSRAARAEAQARAIQGVRFAVGAPEVERSLPWRLWVRRNDIYISARPMGGEMKVSLHESHEHWQLAFTKEHMRRPSPLVRERVQDRWSRPAAFAEGWTRAFVIIVPHAAVVEPVVDLGDAEKIVWIPTPAQEHAVQFTVLISAVDAPAAGLRGFPSQAGYEDVTELVAVLDLTNGERVWLVAHDEPVSPVTKAGHDALRRAVTDASMAALEAASEKDAPFDPRLIMFGSFDDGIRFIVDGGRPGPF